MRKTTNKSFSVPVAIVSGVAVGLGFMFGATCVLTNLVLNGALDENNAMWAVYLSHLLAGFSGGLLSALLTGKNRLLLSLAVGAIQFAVLLLVHYFMSAGPLRGTVTTAVLMLIGAAMAGFVTNYKNSRGAKRVKKYRFV